MASIRKRPHKDGTISHVVRWIQDGSEQHEKFTDELRAGVFRDLVDLAGQKWPDGWTPGEGFVEKKAEPEVPDDRPFDQWGARYIDRLNDIDDRSRADYHRDMRLHVNGVLLHTPEAGPAEAASVLNITEDDVADWVRAEQKGLPDPERPGKWLRKPAAPKSIANRHGMLYSIAQAAVERKPEPLRVDNPFKGTKLPRTDDGTEDEMVFLEHAEYQRLRAELALICGGDALDLADWLVGLGLRWGEATALQKRDLKLDSDRPTVSIMRAWKLGDDSKQFLGPPKTKKSRRTLALTPDQAETARRLVTGKQPDSFVFLTTLGKIWRHNNFYGRRWKPAVTAAVAKGLPRRPRIHDLRHTHVSWLIAANVAPSAIQARVGHESIKTTMDRYGHLMRAHDEEIVAAVAAAMTAPAGTGLRLVAAGA